MGRPHDADPPQPPQPPQIERRIELPTPQVIGAAVLILIPVLGLAGLFDRSQGEQRVELAGIEVHLVYPNRLRYRQSAAIELTVRNTSRQPVDTVRVVFERSYLERFSSVTFVPSADEAGVVILPELDPNEERHVRVDLEAEHPGRQHGMIHVEAGTAGQAELPLRTFVFP